MNSFRPKTAGTVEAKASAISTALSTLPTGAPPLLILNAAQMLTMRGPAGIRRGRELGNLNIIDDGALLVVEGRIREIGLSSRLQNLKIARRAHVISAKHCVVMPAFVDCLHRPLVFRGAGSWAEVNPSADSAQIAKLRLGLMELVSRAGISHQLQQHQTEWARRGTTTMEARIDGDRFGTIRKILRSLESLPHSDRLVTTLNLTPDHDTDSAAESLVPQFRLIESGRVRATGLRISTKDSLDDQETLLRSLIARRRRRASSKRLLTTRRPIRLDLGSHPTAMMVELALRFGVSTLENLGQLPPETIAPIIKTGIDLVFAPAKQFLSGATEVPPIRYLLEQGAGIALGTGFEEGPWAMGTPFPTLKAGCHFFHLSAAEVLTASCINAAHILKVADETGSLEIGKRADFLIIDARDYRDIAHTIDGPPIRHVFRDGTLVE
jgi:imidazolonepropionase